MAGLDSMRKALEAKVRRVADIVAREVENELRQTAPVDSGELRSLIRAQVKATASGARIDIESGTTHAAFVKSHREEWDRVIRDLPDRIDRTWRAVR